MRINVMYAAASALQSDLPVCIKTPAGISFCLSQEFLYVNDTRRRRFGGRLLIPNENKGCVVVFGNSALA